MRSWKRSPLALMFSLVVALAAGCGSAAPASPPEPLSTLVATAQPQAGVYEQASGDSPTTSPAPSMTTPDSLSLEFADPGGAPIAGIIDGNPLQVIARLANPVTTSLDVTFTLQGFSEPFGECVVAQGSQSCSLLLRAEGWAWQDRRPVSERMVLASAGPDLLGQGTLATTPKPLVLVHGLNSDHNAWINWTQPSGYLEEVGLKGYAVGDGQFNTAAMNTGRASKPLAPTLSIAQNAQILADYVLAVSRGTGAERVDLVGHSLGGLISRYYVQNLMPMVEAVGLPDLPLVNQLIMAGTPNGGTVCGRIPAALGLLSPATKQITPEYLTQVFNPAVHERRGVPFFAIAGDAVKPGAIALRCTPAPTDQLVSVESVLRGIAVIPDTLDAIHTDLSEGRSTFQHIFQHISRSPADYPIVVAQETTPAALDAELLQTTIVKGGTLQAGETVTITIPIDQARDATFLLYAPGSLVSMTVKTVAGAILTEETPRTNPNVSFERVFDDSLPLSLGYGVLGPRAGNWEVALTARQTPPGGGPFAVVATVDTDLTMKALVEPAVTDAGVPVTLQATLQPVDAVSTATVDAVIRDATGNTIEQLILLDDGSQGDGGASDGIFAISWQPPAAGDYTVVMAATGQDSTGNNFERLSVLGILVQ